MGDTSFQAKGFLDFLAAPLTVLPLGAGLSLLIVAWVLPQRQTPLLFGGVLGVLLGLGMLLSQWLFAGGDPKLEQLRHEFAAGLDAACPSDRQAPLQEAKQTTTPAPV